MEIANSSAQSEQADREAAKAFAFGLYETLSGDHIIHERLMREGFLAGIAHARKAHAEEVRELVEALKQIEFKKDMTRLADCCVERSCHLNAATGTCSFQTGVNYGYADQASIAHEALAKHGRRA